MDTTGEGSCPTEEGVLLGYVISVDPGGSCRVPTGQKGCCLCHGDGKAADVGRMAKQRVWDEFGEAMEKDFRLALRCF